MFHWICPECGREIPPSVKACQACDPAAVVLSAVEPVPSQPVAEAQPVPPPLPEPVHQPALAVAAPPPVEPKPEPVLEKPPALPAPEPDPELIVQAIVKLIAAEQKLAVEGAPVAPAVEHIAEPEPVVLPVEHARVIPEPHAAKPSPVEAVPEPSAVEAKPEPEAQPEVIPVASAPAPAGEKAEVAAVEIPPEPVAPIVAEAAPQVDAVPAPLEAAREPDAERVAEEIKSAEPAPLAAVPEPVAESEPVAPAQAAVEAATVAAAPPPEPPPAPSKAPIKLHEVPDPLLALAVEIRAVQAARAAALAAPQEPNGLLELAEAVGAPPKPAEPPAPVEHAAPVESAAPVNHPAPVAHAEPAAAAVEPAASEKVHEPETAVAEVAAAVALLAPPEGEKTLILELQAVALAPVPQPVQEPEPAAQPLEPIAATLPEPVAVAAVPEPVALATVPEPAALATLPEPVALATEPEPVALATLPEPVALATAPEPVALATLPEPVAFTTVPEPPLPQPVAEPELAVPQPRQETQHVALAPEPQAEPEGPTLPYAPMQEYKPATSRSIQPVPPRAQILAADSGPRITLPGPTLPPELTRLQDANVVTVIGEQTAQRTKEALPPPKRAGAPGWLISALVMVVLLSIGLAVVYFLLLPRTVADAKPSPTPAVAASTPAPTGGTSPLAKFVEVTGFRIVTSTTDPTKKAEVQYLVVNHSDADISDANVFITLRSAKPGQPPLVRFSFKIPSLGPFEAKEMSSPIEKTTRGISLPDWQDVRADVQISQ